MAETRSHFQRIMTKIRNRFKRLFVCHTDSHSSENTVRENRSSFRKLYVSTPAIVSPMPRSPSPAISVIERFEQQLRTGSKSVDFLRTVPEVTPAALERCRSAPPTFPDTQGLQLYPHQSVCAYAWCRKPRLYPRMYCKKHACHAFGCGGAILLRPPLWPVALLPTQMQINDPHAPYVGPLPGNERLITHEIKDVFCFRHVCALAACKSRRMEGRKYCITHQCCVEGCNLPKPPSAPLYCLDHHVQEQASMSDL